MNEDASFRRTVAHHIIRSLEYNEIPWQRPWVGWGDNVGYPSEMLSSKQFFGVNFILLQMHARTNQFVNKWWSESPIFTKNPVQVVRYERGFVIPLILYNIGDKLSHLQAMPHMKPDYKYADSVFSNVTAKIYNNHNGEALYYYPPHDYISIPPKSAFEGFGKMPSYYGCLAHELIHWTEPRLNCDDWSLLNKELRAEIGTAMLMESLGVPHSAINMNFEKYREAWIVLMQSDLRTIFRVAASASRAVAYIHKFSWFDEVPVP